MSSDPQWITLLAPLKQQLESRAIDLVWDHPKASRLGTTGTLQLAQLLADNSIEYHGTLQSLTLCNSGITSEGLVALLAGLYPRISKTGSLLGPTAAYSSLHTLVLKGNNITLRGIKALVQVLIQDEKLEVLDLYDNSLGNHAVKPLLECLRVNRTLKTLNLWYNRLNAEIAPSLASMIKFNCGLTRLLIGGNDLGDDACHAIVCALQYNRKLLELDLSGNTMSQSLLATVTMALKENTLGERFRQAAVDYDYDCFFVPSAPLYSSIKSEASSSKGESRDFLSILTDAYSSGASSPYSSTRRLSDVDMLEPLAVTTEDTKSGIWTVLHMVRPTMHRMTEERITGPHSEDETIEGENKREWSHSSERFAWSLPEPIPAHARLITKLSLFKLGLVDIPIYPGQFPALTHLDLRQNFLISFPNDLPSQVPLLRELLLSHNLLETLPDSIVMLLHLEHWSIHANPLSLIPKIYVESSLFSPTTSRGQSSARKLQDPTYQNPQKSALWRYLASIRLGGSQEIKLQKAKVMIVGDANVGKTSLLACLHTDFSSRIARWSHKLPKPLATDGIDIEAVKLKLPPSAAGANNLSKVSSVAIAIAAQASMQSFSMPPSSPGPSSPVHPPAGGPNFVHRDPGLFSSGAIAVSSATHNSNNGHNSSSSTDPPRILSTSFPSIPSSSSPLLPRLDSEHLNYGDLARKSDPPGSLLIRTDHGSLGPEVRAGRRSDPPSSDSPHSNQSSVSSMNAVAAAVVAASAVTSINYDVWDFAGQDVYYTTHSFFLTPNTIYLVVFDLSRDDETQMRRIDYWIQSIQTRAGASLSYILLVGTHADEAHPDSISKMADKLNRRWVFSRDVLELVTVSCKTGSGFETLKTSLNVIATKFGLASQLYPKAWLQIGEVLKGIMATQPWISMDKLREISRQFYVTPATLELAVLPALKDIGVVLHFSTDPQLQDTVFINPQFIIKAFADVLTIKHRGFIKSDGILHAKDLHHLWQDERRLFSDLSLMKLFQLFDVAIRLDTNQLLVPALLQDEVPANLADYWPHGIDDISDLRSDTDRILFRRCWVFKFLPIGFFSKIVAQCYRSMNWDVSCHWKGGIVCRNGDGEIALATFNEHTFTLSLRVDGHRYSSILTHIVLLIDTLVTGWYPSAHYAATVPVPNESKDEFIHIPKEDLIDAVRLSSDTKAIFRTSEAQGHGKGEYRVDLLAPDLALYGLKQISLEELDQELECGQLSGKGGQGRVFRGTFRGRKVAIKRFEVNLMACEDDFETQQEWLSHKRALTQRAQLTLQHETLILKNARHPNIVRLVGFNIHRLVVLLEFISHGHLESYLSRNGLYSTTTEAAMVAETSSAELVVASTSNPSPSPLPDSDNSLRTSNPSSSAPPPTSRSPPIGRRPRNALSDPFLQMRIALDLASALSYLHGLKPAILHRDLSANNIMLESLDAKAPVCAKLVDFGTASFVGKVGLGAYHNEKSYCLAPEVLRGRDHSYKSDVYSFGIILWQLWTGLFSHGLSANEVIRGERPPLDCPSDGWKDLQKSASQAVDGYCKLILKCWNPVPEARPEFAEILVSLVDIAITIGMDSNIVTPYKTNVDHGVSNQSNEWNFDAFDLAPIPSITDAHAVPPSMWKDCIVYTLPKQDNLDSKHQWEDDWFLLDSFILSKTDKVTALLWHKETLYIGSSEGNLLRLDQSTIGVPQDLRFSGATANKFPTKVAPDSILQFIPWKDQAILYLTDSNLFVLDVMKEKDENAEPERSLLAPTIAIAYPSNDIVIIGTAIGYVHVWSVGYMKRIVGVSLPFIERVLGLHLLEERPSVMESPREPKKSSGASTVGHTMDYDSEEDSSSFSAELPPCTYVCSNGIDSQVESCCLVVAESRLYILTGNFELARVTFSGTIGAILRREKISASFVDGETCWLGCRSGSIYGFGMRRSSVSAAVIFQLRSTLKLHSRPITLIKKVEPEKDGQTLQMLSIGEDAMIWWDPTSLEPLERPTRYKGRPAPTHAAVASSTALYTTSLRSSSVLRWSRPKQ